MSSNKSLRVPSRTQVTFRKRNMGHTSKFRLFLQQDIGLQEHFSLFFFLKFLPTCAEKKAQFE